MGKRTNYVPKPIQVARTILEKEKEGKPESVVSLKNTHIIAKGGPPMPFANCTKLAHW
jgi:hypothetical protein